MLESLTLDTFAPQVGGSFRLHAGDVVVPLTLTSADALGGGGSGLARRQPFSLTFHAADGAALPQDIYRIASDALPDLELFLVPLGPDAGGMRYEAIFT